MIIGVTASRVGLTAHQRNVFRSILEDNDVTRVHHGDCIGGDADIHDLCVQHDIPVVIHPPTNPKYRAWCSPNSILEPRPPRPYLDRNRDIVTAVDLLVGFPKEHKEPEVARGQGTWSTIRYARVVKKDHLVIWPLSRN